MLSQCSTTEIHPAPISLLFMNLSIETINRGKEDMLYLLRVGLYKCLWCGFKLLDNIVNSLDNTSWFNEQLHASISGDNKLYAVNCYLG
jgi:hypothetical protein